VWIYARGNTSVGDGAAARNTTTEEILPFAVIQA
jgi:hypothetical protein